MLISFLFIKKPFVGFGKMILQFWRL